jgi:hypothetical protein
MASGQWRRLPPNSAPFRWVFAVPGARVRTARQPRSSHRVVTPGHVLAWAHGIGLSGREPSSATVGARIACLSSYYRFLIRMQVAAGNPYDALERPKGVQSAARGLGADEVRRLLAVIPDTVAGRRDRALVLAFVLTGPGVVSFLDAVSRKTPLSPSGSADMHLCKHHRTAVRVCQHDKSSPGRFLRWPKNGQPPSGSFCFASVRIGDGKPQCGSSCFRTVGKDSTLIMTSVVPMEHDSTGPVADHDDDLVLEENGQSERVDIKSPGPSKV